MATPQLCETTGKAGGMGNWMGMGMGMGIENGNGNLHKKLVTWNSESRNTLTVMTQFNTKVEYEHKYAKRLKN